MGSHSLTADVINGMTLIIFPSQKENGAKLSRLFVYLCLPRCLSASKDVVSR